MAHGLLAIYLFNLTKKLTAQSAQPDYAVLPKEHLIMESC